MTSVWTDIINLARGAKFAAVEVLISAEEKARQHTMASVSTDEITLLPSYLGRRAYRVRVEETPPERMWPA